MSVQIEDQCVTCGACLWECPSEAISPGAVRPIVRQAACTECYGFFGESQCIVVCPANAISVVMEPIEDLQLRFRSLSPGAAPQDTWIWQRTGRLAVRAI
jgi:ferredoxin